MKNKEINNAINQLAELFDNGVLMADTDPTEFLNQIADEIKRLRMRIVELKLVCSSAYYALEHPDACGDDSDYAIKELKKVLEKK